jgi:uncharacterized membrane protein
MSRVMSILLWFSVLGCGLLGGVFFAFSTFVMAALGRIEHASGIAAMNSINTSILRSLFMPVFLASTLAALALAVLALARWGESGSVPALGGGAIYVLGMFAVTMMCNVPLNNELQAVDPATTAASTVWARYMRDWTFWNHVRTVASLTASLLFTVAIAVR